MTTGTKTEALRQYVADNNDGSSIHRETTDNGPLTTVAEVLSFIKTSTDVAWLKGVVGHADNGIAIRLAAEKRLRILGKLATIRRGDSIR